MTPMRTSFVNADDTIKSGYSIPDMSHLPIESQTVTLLVHVFMSTLIEPHHEKTGFLPMQKQRRRSAS